MIDAYTIGITLALNDGVSAGIAAIRRDLAALDGAIANSAAGLLALRRLAEQVSMPTTPALPVAPPREHSAKPTSALETPPAPPAPAVRLKTPPAPPAPAVPQQTRAPSPARDAPSPPAVPSVPSPQAVPGLATQDALPFQPPQSALAPPTPAPQAAPAPIPTPTTTTGDRLHRGAAPVSAAPPSPATPRQPLATPAQPNTRSADSPDYANVAKQMVALGPAPRSSNVPPTQQARPQPADFGRLARSAPSATQQDDAALERPVASELIEIPTIAVPIPRLTVTPAASPVRHATEILSPASAAPIGSPGRTPTTPTGSAISDPLTASAMPSATQSPPLGRGMGVIYLEGQRLGRWFADEMADRAARPTAGFTGLDPRLSPTFPGAASGG